MTTLKQNIAHLKVGTMNLELHPTRAAAGEAAAHAVAQELRRLDKLQNEIGVIFATGASQLAMLDALTAIPGLPWNKVVGFHMDEYVGLNENHVASFRRYLREKLNGRVAMREFHEMNGNAPDIHAYGREYMRRMNDANPQICLLGIGENGHLAFNDPHEADFNDPEEIKVVTLDSACKQQQVSEGWFENENAVPKQALTLTIPTLLRVPKLIVSVPGNRKAEAIRRTLDEPTGIACPATILRTHPDVTIYVDPESASAVADRFI